MEDNYVFVKCKVVGNGRMCYTLEDIVDLVVRYLRDAIISSPIAPYLEVDCGRGENGGSIMSEIVWSVIAFVLNRVKTNLYRKVSK